MSETNSERMDLAAKENGWSVTVQHGVRTYKKHGSTFEVVMRDEEILRVREDGAIVAYRHLAPNPTQSVIDMLSA
jgi:hypothetical protein